MSLKKRLDPYTFSKLLLTEKRTFSEIAGMYNVTKQRAHQLYKEYLVFYPDLFSVEEKNLPTKEQIINQFKKDLFVCKVAKNLDISYYQLRQLMVQHNIEKVYLKDILNKETLEDLYINQKLSDKAIASMFHCTVHTVAKARYRYDIYEKMKNPVEEIIPEAIFKKLYIDEDLTLNQISEVFNVDLKKIFNLKWFYKIKKNRSSGVDKETLEKIKIQYKR